MTDHLHPHGELRLVAPASPGLAPVAGAVLRYLAAVIDEQGDLPDGAVVGWWWWPLTVARHDDTRRLLPPEGYGEDLTTVLGLFSLQLGLARRLGVEPVGHEPDGLVHLAPGALTTDAVMLERAGHAAPGSTGWHVREDGPLTGYPDDYEAMPLPAVAAQRPGLIAPLALPPGLLVRMRGDVVTSVIDASKTERLPPEPPR